MIVQVRSSLYLSTVTRLPLSADYKATYRIASQPLCCNMIKTQSIREERDSPSSGSVRYTAAAAGRMAKMKYWSTMTGYENTQHKLSMGETSSYIRELKLPLSCCQCHHQGHHRNGAGPSAPSWWSWMTTDISCESWVEEKNKFTHAAHTFKCYV